MDRVAVFVDAGYVFAQSSVLLAGRKLARGEISLDNERFLGALAEFAERVSGLPLLRIYWYDGTSTGPTSQHIALAYLPRLKLRLGFVNSVGEQKGVDSLIITDMITLARNGAIAEAVLLSGDEDLRVGVQQAQEYGVRIHLLGIKPSRGSQSVFLLQEADSTHEWAEGDLAPYVACKAKEAPTVTAPPTTAALPRDVSPAGRLPDVARLVAGEVEAAELEALVASLRGTGQVPKELDGKLLAKGRALLKRDLDAAQKRGIRTAFREQCELRLQSLATPTPSAPARGA